VNDIIKTSRLLPDSTLRPMGVPRRGSFPLLNEELSYSKIESDQIQSMKQTRRSGSQQQKQQHQSCIVCSLSYSVRLPTRNSNKINDTQQENTCTSVIQLKNSMNHECELLLDEFQRVLVLNGCALTWIDFTDLKYMLNTNCALEEVHLTGNHLDTISLDAFSCCKNLKYLALNGNSLTEIDLNPLRSCVMLKRLWLNRNRLESLDLSPLAACLEFTALCLDDNCIDSNSVDFSPLSQCIKMCSIRLKGNRLNGICDVTVMLQMQLLSSFVVDDHVRVFVQAESVYSNYAKIPCALRRLGDRLVFSAEPFPTSTTTTNITQTDQTSGSTHNEMIENSKVKVLLVNFTLREFYSVREKMTLMNKKYPFDCVGVSKLWFIQGSVDEYSLVMIRIKPADVESMTSRLIREVRVSFPHIPLVCIVENHVVKDWAVRCAKFGVERCIPVSISNTTVTDLYKLAMKPRKRIQKSKSTRANTAESEYRRINASSEGNSENVDLFAAIKQGTIPPLKAIFQKNSNVPPVAIGGISRNEMEKLALRKLFGRYHNEIQWDQFQPVTTLCGLPACATGLLCECISLQQQQNDGSSSDGRSIRVETFLEFWHAWLEFASPEQRLFRIFRILSRIRSSNSLTKSQSQSSRSKSAWSSQSVLISLAENLSRGFRIKTSLPGGEQQCYSMLAAMLLHCLNGAARVEHEFSERCMRNNNFCARLIAAESEIFEGPFTAIDPYRLIEYRTQFESWGGKVSDDSNSAVNLSEHQVTSTCSARWSLIPRAVAAIFAVHTGPDRVMNLSTFARFWAAQSDLASNSAIEYWFRVLDEDLDGFISRKDAQSFYSEKCKLRLIDGIHLCEFSFVWRGIVDLVCPRHPDELIALSELLALPARNRVFILQALLFRQDGNIVLDVRRTSNIIIL